MTGIDLTPMNEATARALFAEQYADYSVRAQEEASVEELAELRIQVRDAAKAAWDAGIVVEDTVFRYRELALAATLVNWKSVARQAWAVGRKASPESVNPYLEETPGA